MKRLLTIGVVSLLIAAGSYVLLKDRVQCNLALEPGGSRVPICFFIPKEVMKASGDTTNAATIPLPSNAISTIYPEPPLCENPEKFSDAERVNLIRTNERVQSGQNRIEFAVVPGVYSYMPPSKAVEGLVAITDNGTVCACRRTEEFSYFDTGTILESGYIKWDKEQSRSSGKLVETFADRTNSFLTVVTQRKLFADKDYEPLFLLASVNIDRNGCSNWSNSLRVYDQNEEFLAISQNDVCACEQ